MFSWVLTVIYVSLMISWIKASQFYYEVILFLSTRFATVRWCISTLVTKIEFVNLVTCQNGNWYILHTHFNEKLNTAKNILYLSSWFLYGERNYFANKCTPYQKVFKYHINIILPPFICLFWCGINHQIVLLVFTIILYQKFKPGLEELDSIGYE